MIWLHIGMPKAGSSSLQAYLARNAESLRPMGLHYMQTGRMGGGSRRVPLPAHNTLARQMARGWADAEDGLFDAYVQEFEANRDTPCLLSAEMFFGQDLAPLQDKIFSRVDDDITVLLYIRRLSDFLESDYKQKAKNGRAPSKPEVYAANHLRRMETDPEFYNLSVMAERIETALPRAKVLPRLFSREDLAGRDMVTDFLTLFGIDTPPVAPEEAASNRSHSRVAAEALGLFLGEEVGMPKRLHRRLDAALQNSPAGDFSGKGDVLLHDEACDLNEMFEERNAAFRRQHFPDRYRLFAALKPPTDPTMARGHPSELERHARAVRELLRLKTEMGL